MTVSAPMAQYVRETVMGFEQRSSSGFQAASITQYQQNGSTAIFNVGSSGSANATTRGLNGLIPARNDSNSAKTCTLAEWHDLVEKTGFNIFESQDDQRALMQKTSAGVIYRKLDDLSIDELSTGTQTTGASATGSIALIQNAITYLSDVDVDVEEEENMFCAVSPRLRAYLMQTTEFTSGDYVEVKPYNGPVRKMWRWGGVNFFTSNRLSGIRTATEKCLMWHRNALGYAAKQSNLTVDVGYEGKQDIYHCRTSLFGGAKLLQNSGIVIINHDGSAPVAL